MVDRELSRKDEVWLTEYKMTNIWNFETKVLGLNMLKIHYNFKNISFIPQIFD